MESHEEEELDDFGIVVHGGAGSLPQWTDAPQRRRFLAESANTGYNVLKRKGGSSLDAVEEAIKVLEDCKIFNAGSGSALTIEGDATADASIMVGDLSCGAVANISVSKNPISLARKVMEECDHVFMVGDDGLGKFSKAIGLNPTKLEPAARRLEQYQDNLKLMKKGRMKTWPKNYRLVRSYLSASRRTSRATPENSDTVGAVAIDSTSRVCAGVSTGGRWLKLPGRVGDSAVIGSGIYADSLSGAASATGAGEDIIKVCLSKTVCDFMRAGVDAQKACEAAISILTERRGVGTAGIIAVDKYGRFGAARNTEILQRAFRFESMSRVHVALFPDDKDPPVRKPPTVDETVLRF